MSVPTLPEFLREAGYWTIGIVSNPFLFRAAGFERGFDDWVEVGERPSGEKPRNLFQYLLDPEPRAAKHVNAAAVQALSRRPHDGFFLYVHYMDVHDYHLREKEYWTAVAEMDHTVGELLQKLKEEGLYDGTVILFTSDHGERLKEQHLVIGLPQHLGNPSFEEVLRVPLIVSPPRFDDTARLVSSQDVFQLIAAIAGVRPRVPQALERGELFLTETGWRTYRKGRWKSFIMRGRDQIYLVDLAEDPGERRDVSSQNPSVVAAHRKRSTDLAQQLAATHAPPSELSPEDLVRLRALGYLE
jgi:arylsulfatase A-like enzyme